MTENTPIDPDVLQAVIEAMELADYSGVPWEQGDEAIARVVIGAYLAVAQPAAQKLTDAEWQAFQAIPDQGYSHRAWVDARIAERVTVAQPEVNSVEELEALPGGSMVKSGGREFYKTSYVELPWILPYGADRFGSEYLAKHSKVTVIHRPEVNDA